MDFRLTDEQTALRDGMRALLEGRFGREGLRRAADGTGPPWDAPLWKELAEAGLFALRLPEEEGGVGLGLPEAALLFEEAGRALVPGPLVATHLAAGLVPGAAEGTCVVTEAGFPPGERTALVAHLPAAHRLLRLDDEDGAGTVRAPHTTGVAAGPLRSVDPATPLHRVDADAVADGPVLDGADARRLRREAAVLTAAQQLGSAGRTVETAVEHARHREQFGSPVGAFQAVKHLCAEMLVRLETARAAVYAAAVTGTESDCATAKLLADEAAVRNARDCLQVHGGMGFTWEADVHLHLKRAWVLERVPPAREELEERLAAAL
ncbi:acyl-CoA dehydrogenase family protein [Streptomyces sp. HNM0574]|uniref:acyl-CoA dehydrogenase family protein n=1 Tax=Streptomyces sp. HNM0574 TaxID=2714954 RepID=UPI00146B907F|nr:acyl-CoA/acyl-ACP dehydrogenase [Streptomyces sp. HNM0574]